MRADAAVIRELSATGLATAPAQPIIRLQGVGYRTPTTAILSNLSLSITAGAPTILMGPNGAGKTTLLKLLMGLIEPSTGQLDARPCDDGSPARRAFVFQRPVMLKRTVAANLAFALASIDRPATPQAITDLLRTVGLEHLADRPARRLSGGEQQRLALARALAREPDMLILDEPSASLDPAQTQIVEDIIRQTSARGVKVVMATHDLGQARRLAGDVVFLAAGTLAEHTPARTFFERPESDAARRFLAGELVL